MHFEHEKLVTNYGFANKHFLGKFYKIMGSLTPALAWGFLGDDATLKPICTSIRNNVITALNKVSYDIKFMHLKEILRIISESLFEQAFGKRKKGHVP